MDKKCDVFPVLCRESPLLSCKYMGDAVYFTMYNCMERIGASMIRKLHCNRGMSVLFSLLILLVCGVVASVVLAAATSSAGRLSDVADGDRRYYSVTSAAELLHEVLCEESGVTVEQIRTDVTTRVSTTASNGTETVTDTTDTSYSVRMDGAELLEGMPATLLQKLALGMVFDGGDWSGEGAQQRAWEEALYGQSKTESFALRLRVGDSDDELLSALSVQVQVTREKSGLLTLVVSNLGDDSVYSIRMTLMPAVEQENTAHTREEDPVILRDEESGTVTETVVVTAVESRVTEIRWILIDMEGVSSYAAS